MRARFPIIGLLVLLRGRFAVQVLRAIVRRKIGAWHYPKVDPYQQIRPEARSRILVLGDSTAVGTGADDSVQTIAGYLGKDFPEAHIVNIGVNGLKVSDLKDQLARVQDQHFGLALVSVDANDVIQGFSPEHLERELRELLDRAKRIAGIVILVNQGNLGNAPLLPRSIVPVFTYRSRALRKIFRDAASKLNVRLVDLFVERENDHWRRDPQAYYSVDWFHPNGRGYREWYEKIRDAWEHGD